MAEYIDKKAAIADLNETYDKMAGFHAQFYNGYQVAVNRLRVFPAAEVEPVRHGQWIDCVDDYACDYIRCSACGAEYASWLDECTHTNFCPECGADMRGGADNG